MLREDALLKVLKMEPDPKKINKNNKKKRMLKQTVPKHIAGCLWPRYSSRVY